MASNSSNHGSHDSKKRTAETQVEILDKSDKKRQDMGSENARFIFEPRSYQSELFTRATEQNTIVCLGTGTGKTHIAVMLMKSRMAHLRNLKEKKIIVFLVPSVPLSLQQTDVIDKDNDLKVKRLSGDSYNISRWRTEVENYDVLVMTPQLLLNSLQHALMSLEIVDLLILDECHHAQRNHPYVVIMRNFYRNVAIDKRPKIFGMTASPVNSKGVTSEEDCAKKLQDLEDILDAKLATVEMTKDFEAIMPAPRTILKTYELYTPSVATEAALEFLNSLHMEQANSDQVQKSSTIGRIRKRVRRLVSTLSHCVEDLGLYCAFQATEVKYRDVETSNILQYEWDASIRDSLINSEKRILELSRERLRCELPVVGDLMDEASREERIREQLRLAVREGLLTPKVELLVLEILNNRVETKGSEFHCIVFAERVVDVDVLANLLGVVLKDVIKCKAIAGGRHRTRAQLEDTLKAFRKGEINVLISTNVVEEGVDIPACNAVLLFDLSKNVCSFTQSRGRARMTNSKFVIFVRRDSDERYQVSQLLESEDLIRKEVSERTSLDQLMESDYKVAESYRVDSTGAVIDTDGSVALVNHYCSKLPSGSFCILQPLFVTEQEKDGFVTQVRLPSNAPIEAQLVRGPIKRSTNAAKQAACLEVIRKLHALNALTDHLLPVTGDEEVGEDSNKAEAKVIPKIVELKVLVPRALQGTSNGLRSVSEDILHLFVYSISINVERTSPSSWTTRDIGLMGLFTEVMLDPEAASTSLRLSLPYGGSGRATLTPCGTVSMDKRQVECAKAFHSEFFCEALLRCTRCACPSETSFQTSIPPTVANGLVCQTLWNSERAYCLLPLVTKNELSGTGIDVDWSVVESAIDIFSKARKEGFVEQIKNAMAQVKESEGEGRLITAMGSMAVEEIIGMTGNAIHNRCQYYIDAVRTDLTAESPFPDSKYKSYEEYFYKKHNWQLKFPKQPMLSVRRVTKARSSLVHPSTIEVELSEKPLSERAFAEIPPELCWLVAPSPYFRAAQILPSVMHRVEMLQGACELRDRIADEMEKPILKTVRGCKVMEALTSAECHDEFNLERHEFLGDTVLKYGVTCHFFHSNPEDHEGLLTKKRSQEVCNVTLCLHALNKGLQNYLRVTHFTVEDWAAPGLPLSSNECSHNRSGRFRDLEKDIETQVEQELPQKSSIETLEKEAFDSMKDEVTEGKVTERMSMDIDGEVEVKKKIVDPEKKKKKRNRVLMKAIADMVEALIGVYWQELKSEIGLEGGLLLMEWVGIPVELAKVGNEYVWQSGKKQGEAMAEKLNCLDKLQCTLGYTFKNKELLAEAFTHASFQDMQSYTRCYERLEFLGDAFLDLAVTQHLEMTNPDLSPGSLTDLRSASVNNNSFALIALKPQLELQEYLQYSSQSLRESIEYFVNRQKAELQRKGHERSELSFEDGENEAPKVLGDLLEALAGAMLVDSCFDFSLVWNHLNKFFEPFPTVNTLKQHPRRQLLELCQARKWTLVFEVKILSAGYQVEALVNGHCMGEVEQRRKDAGIKMASAKALKALNEGKVVQVEGETKMDIEIVETSKTGKHVGGQFQLNVLEDGAEKVGEQVVKEDIQLVKKRPAPPTGKDFIPAAPSPPTNPLPLAVPFTPPRELLAVQDSMPAFIDRTMPVPPTEKCFIATTTSPPTNPQPLTVSLPFASEVLTGQDSIVAFMRATKRTAPIENDFIAPTSPPFTSPLVDYLPIPLRLDTFMDEWDTPSSASHSGLNLLARGLRRKHFTEKVVNEVPMEPCVSNNLRAFPWMGAREQQPMNQFESNSEVSRFCEAFSRSKYIVPSLPWPCQLQNAAPNTSTSRVVEKESISLTNSLMQSELEELCQRRCWRFFVTHEEQSGPSHCPRFELEGVVFGNDRTVIEKGVGSGRKKKEAKHAVAADILRKLKERGEIMN